MFRSQVIRRALALSAVAAAATAAALAVSAPASAHRTSVSGTAVCDTETGNWVVTWTVSNSEDHVAGSLTFAAVAPSSTRVTNIAYGAVLPAGGSITGEQIAPGSETSASLTVKAKWDNGKFEKYPQTGTVEFEGTCEEESEQPPTPTPTPTETSSPPAEETPVPSPSTTPVPGEGGGLPVTGAATGGIVAAAAALLALGVGLFLVARRRRIRFTA
ncbi:MAG TPA: LPXTG cell wall anchor domain-containing protein [Micromonosporaceae bacterium]|nr:LPXTG cell wall anchor domain-containing protein [Micromonosporaceae bacterium]